MNVVPEKVLEYIRTIQPLCEGKLGTVQKEAMKNGLPVIRPETVQFLKVLLKIHKPTNILEIGCAVGFSAGLFATHTYENAKITTMERNQEMVEKAQSNFEYLGIKDKVNLLIGDAIDILPNLNNEYDFIFLDAAKAQYVHYLPYCIQLVRQGGLIVSDDVLQGGYIADEAHQVPRRIRTIHKRMNDYLEKLISNDLLETSIIPIGDGLTLSVKK